MLCPKIFFNLNLIHVISDSELVGIDTEEELDYIEQRIEQVVKAQGQQFGHEQWWTGASRVTANSEWHWRDG